MKNPFVIDSPTCISFSGGRTSAYMLWRVLQANDGLPKDAVVCFANTGKEEEATLRFVRDCSDRWGVPITWLEYRNDDQGFVEVTFDTAGRNGEPFEALLNKRPMLPNRTMRFCTTELKIRPIAEYLMAVGFDGSRTELENASWVGIRGDEPRRAAKIQDKSRIPLWVDGVSAADVGNFWQLQPFDLQLPNFNGRTMHGNCDLCFLKPGGQVLSLIKQNPDRAVWWARMEEMAAEKATTTIAGRFRKDRPSYAQMMQYASQQLDMFDQAEEGMACFCGD